MSGSKAAAENIIYSYMSSYFCNKNKKHFISVARAGNVIGGGDWSEDRIIPVVEVFKGKNCKYRNPNSTRPWQHVLEAVGGYLILAAKLDQNKNLHNQAFNFGPSKNNNFKVIELINNIKNWNNIKFKTVKSKKVIRVKIVTIRLSKIT